MNCIPINCHMHPQSYLILRPRWLSVNLLCPEERFTFMINNLIPNACLGDICIYTLGLASCAPLVNVDFNTLNVEECLNLHQKQKEGQLVSGNAYPTLRLWFGWCQVWKVEVEVAARADCMASWVMRINIIAFQTNWEDEEWCCVNI